MAADNNLKEECVFALTEILRLGSLAEVDVIVQLDSGEALTRYDFRKLRTTSRPKGSGSAATNGRQPDLDDLADVIISDPITIQNVSDAAMLSNFLNHTVGESDLNLVVLSGHGSGAVGDFLNTDNPPSALSIPKLRAVIEPIERRIGRKIDILGMDSCLMSMVEVCYELHQHIDFLIGAEGFEQNSGWPYHEILSLFKGKKQINPQNLAPLIVQEYIKYYSQYHISGVSVDMSVIDLSNPEKIKNLTAAINNLAILLKDNLYRPQIKNAVLLAHWRAQSYKFEQYSDLWDFCYLLANDLQSGIYNLEAVKNIGQFIDEFDEIRTNPKYFSEIVKNAEEWESIRRSIEAACSSVILAINAMVPLTGYNGASSQHSHGLSIYFPWSKTELEKNLGLYKKLAFADLTKWDEFLEAYVAETQRELRDDEGLLKKNVRPLGMFPKGVGEARNNPQIETRNNPQIEIRNNPQIETRNNPQIETRNNPQIETRNNPQIETRGKLAFAPQVKNPPTEFFKDNLAGKLRKKVGVIYKKR
jgi:hypothetical protein